MRVVIIGLGLIGGSIGLALKQANWQKAQIVGFIRRSEVGQAALNMGAVDEVETSMEKAVHNSDLIIIATPVLTIKDIMVQIAPHLSHDCIITDAASTKLQVMQWAQELLPPTTCFIGGHPMAGKETSGIKAAEADLFSNATYCLVPGPQATQKAIQTITDMVEKLGATPFSISAWEHDHLVAGISHLPLVLSVALISATTGNSSWEQMSQLASSGYRDLTRLASGSPEVNSHILLSNQSAIVTWIDEYIKELQRLRKLINTSDYEMQNVLAHASEAREKWLAKRFQQKSP